MLLRSTQGSERAGMRRVEYRQSGSNEVCGVTDSGGSLSGLLLRNAEDRE